MKCTGAPKTADKKSGRRQVLYRYIYMYEYIYNFRSDDVALQIKQQQQGGSRKTSALNKNRAKNKSGEQKISPQQNEKWQFNCVKRSVRLAAMAGVKERGADRRQRGMHLYLYIYIDRYVDISAVSGDTLLKTPAIASSFNWEELIKSAYDLFISSRSNRIGLKSVALFNSNWVGSIFGPVLGEMSPGQWLPQIACKL